MNTPHRHSPDRQRFGREPRRVAHLALAAGLLLAGVASAAPQLKTVEECLESGTRAISLPGTTGGTLSASTCSGCPTLRLAFDARTVYVIGKQQVSYAKFREIAAKDDLRLEVFYQPQTRVLTRLRVPDTGNGK